MFLTSKTDIKIFKISAIPNRARSHQSIVEVVTVFCDNYTDKELRISGQESK